MNSLCIVTSYIDINRDEWTHFKRTTNDYIEGFKPYLYFTEDIILFIDSRHYDTLQTIVSGSGKKNISLIPIDEEFLCRNIPSWSFIQREGEIMSSYFYKHLLYEKNNPEHTYPKYNVIQHSKLDFVKYVIDNNLTGCKYLCWSDFGFFMNKEKIPQGLENGNLSFNLMDIDENRVNYCTINHISDTHDRSIYFTLTYPFETIGGFFFLATKEKHIEYNSLYKEVLQREFYDMGLTDDDQHVALRCYFNKPDLFTFYNLGWHNTYTHFYTQSKKYTLVCPLSIDASDNSSYFQFIQIGVKSYLKHLDLNSLQEFIIVCPEKDFKYVQILSYYYPEIPFRYYKDEDIVKEECSGWMKQQLIKLNIAKYVKTNMYIPLDGDLLLLKKLTYDDLFSEKKIKYSSEIYQEQNNSNFSVNSNWVKNSCDMLKYPLEKVQRVMSVTPQILYTSYVLELLDEYGPFFNKTFIEKECTEFSLYWIYLLKRKLHHNYIDCTYKNPLWRHERDTNVLEHMSEKDMFQRVKKAMDNPDTFFCVIQSWLKLDTTCISHLYTENVVFICSIIKGSPGSVFDKENRVNQTVNTIITTKKKIPNAYIILEEISELDDDVYTLFMCLGVNIIFTQYNVFSIKGLISAHKTMGEIYLIKHALEYIKDTMRDVPYKRIFKIGGRNFLNEGFNLLDHKETHINVKKNPEQDDFYTTLFSLGKNRLDDILLIFSTAQLTNNLGMYLERGLYHFLKEYEWVNSIATLGCSGTFSMTGISWDI